MAENNVRKRTIQTSEGETDKVSDGGQPDIPAFDKEPLMDKAKPLPDRLLDARSKSSKHLLFKGSYWLTRIILLRFMGFIYLVAFTVSLHQNKQLLGSRGLLPAHLHLDRLHKRFGGSGASPWSLITAAPTLLWLADYHNHLDFWLDVLAWAGLAIASFMVITGAGNWFLLFVQWMLYHSLVSVGQTWFGFGWESQVLETGFLTIFLAPMISLSPLPSATPPSKVVLWGYRWLIFRIMMGAGLIKIRGDKCWRDLTCMNYHYETQPVPSPVSYFLHQSPAPVHQLEVLGNHLVELLAPALVLLPGALGRLGGLVQVAFQVILIISGNLSFLNWLTILPSLACFDDHSLAWMFGEGIRCRVAALILEEKKEKRRSISRQLRRVFNVSLGLLLAWLSVPVLHNLLSPQQRMNTNFDPFRLVNSYGAFGSITKQRTEVVLQGTNASDPASPGAKWLEYEFHCKPGAVSRRPCLISPYHYRLDWLMWFAAFQNYQHNPWLVHLVAKLLVQDPSVQGLLQNDPFLPGQPPRYIRAQHYKYSFTKMGSPAAKKGAWWRRSLKGQYLPPVSLAQLQGVVTDMGWPQPRPGRPDPA